MAPSEACGEADAPEARKLIHEIQLVDTVMEDQPIQRRRRDPWWTLEEDEEEEEEEGGG